MIAGRRASDLAVILRLLRHGRRYWPHLAVTFAVSLLAIPITLLTPLPMKLVVDSVLGSQPLPAWLGAVLPATWTASAGGLLGVAAGLMLGLAVLRNANGMANWLLQTYTGERLTLDFRASLFRHAQRLSLAYHDTQGTADTIYRIQYDAPAIRHITIDGLVPFLTAAATLAGMVYVTARLDWQLAVVALAIAPLIAMVTRVSKRRLREEWTAVKDNESQAMSVVQEVFGAVRVVMAFGQEEREHERFVRHSTHSMRGQMRVATIQGGFDLLMGTLIAVGTAAALVIGVTHVRAGMLTVGELLIVMAYLAQLYAPIDTISKKATVLQSSLASADRVLTLLDRMPDVVEQPDARPLDRAAGAVEFRDVSFAYENAHHVLEHVSFTIAPGTRVGIVGTTGAGKTTLINLLTRFYDPLAGQVMLDGADVRSYRLADLRNQFGIVLQDPVLFPRSIAENIAYARPSATEEEIVAAARAANAHDFIVQLPDGYQTLVGERGMRLSGGERQRISIARAFLRDAPILLLDEPTSSLDSATEAVIMEAMVRLMHGRTTFMIAHRLSTLSVCDVCLRLERGRPIELVPPGEIQQLPVEVPDEAGAESTGAQPVGAPVGR
jgi:ATP-binding cassette subfamily B protein